ncbi:hypothetical protein OAC78_05260 [Litorivicinus sp.]|jgi:hypothetical protein|nr:hypothetical protein [Litorivicinus sp.]
MDTEKHNFFQKVWWWIVTLAYLVIDVDIAIHRLSARQACLRGQCQLRGAEEERS